MPASPPDRFYRWPSCIEFSKFWCRVTGLYVIMFFLLHTVYGMSAVVLAVFFTMEMGQYLQPFLWMIAVETELFALHAGILPDNFKMPSTDWLFSGQAPHLPQFGGMPFAASNRSSKPPMHRTKLSQHTLNGNELVSEFGGYLLAIISVGLLMVMINGLGIVGIVKKNKLLSEMIQYYMMFLIFCECVFTFLWVVDLTPFWFMTKQKLYDIMAGYEGTGSMSAHTIAIDGVQLMYQCCGVVGPDDYKKYPPKNWERIKLFKPSGGSFQPNARLAVPVTCCQADVDAQYSLIDPYCPTNGGNGTNPYGCLFQLFFISRAHWRVYYWWGIYILSFLIFINISLVMCVSSYFSHYEWIHYVPIMEGIPEPVPVRIRKGERDKNITEDYGAYEPWNVIYSDKLSIRQSYTSLQKQNNVVNQMQKTMIPQREDYGPYHPKGSIPPKKVPQKK